LPGQADEQHRFLSRMPGDQAVVGSDALPRSLGRRAVAEPSSRSACSVSRSTGASMLPGVNSSPPFRVWSRCTTPSNPTIWVADATQCAMALVGAG
jgi:hypothetical protein